MKNYMAGRKNESILEMEYSQTGTIEWWLPGSHSTILRDSNMTNITDFDNWKITQGGVMVELEFNPAKLWAAWVWKHEVIRVTVKRRAQEIFKSSNGRIG